MAAKISDVDRRHTPRIKTDTPIRISDEIGGKLVNINDSGVCFSLSKPVAVKDCRLSIEFPSDPVRVRVRIKWNRKAEEGGEFLYGASFVNPENNVLPVIRRYMVSKQFRFVVRDIKDKEIRKHVLIFARHFRDYIFGLADLCAALSSRKTRKDHILGKLKALTDDIVGKGQGLKRSINNKLIIRKIKNEFRMLAGCWAFKSQIVKRGFDKPRGYPGDFETIEAIYDKKIFSPDTELGYYFDVYFLENPYAEAVRNRKDKLREILQRVLESRKGKTRVLNLACGSSRELWELYKDNRDIGGAEAEYTLLDWDEQALNFSKDRLKGVSKTAKFNFMKEDVVQFVRNTGFFDRNGKQDLIYSIGLADYLPDRVLKNMIANSFAGLNPKGKFIIAHKDKRIEFSHLPPEWFCDWEFYERDEEDMLALIDSARLEDVAIDVEREKTRNIFFITLAKK